MLGNVKKYILFYYRLLVCYLFAARHRIIGSHRDALRYSASRASWSTTSVGGPLSGPTALTAETVSIDNGVLLNLPFTPARGLELPTEAKLAGPVNFRLLLRRIVSKVDAAAGSGAVIGSPLLLVISLATGRVGAGFVASETGTGGVSKEAMPLVVAALVTLLSPSRFRGGTLVDRKKLRVLIPATDLLTGTTVTGGSG